MRKPHHMTYEDWFWQNTKIVGECLESTFSLCTTTGYAQFSFAGKNVGAHRFAWLTRRGEIPKGHHVRHLCQNRRCVKIEHLAVGTPADNALDAKRHASAIRGVRAWNAVATEADAMRMHELRKQGYTNIAIATELGFKESTVQKITSGINWAHLLPDGVVRGVWRKLSDRDVRAIHKLAARDWTTAAIADLFEVHVTTVQKALAALGAA